MSDEPFVWKPCIQKNSGASGPINKFGQHRYMVLSRVAAAGTITATELHNSMTLTNIRIDEVLERLVDDGFIDRCCGAPGTEFSFSTTQAGRDALLAL